MYLRVMFFVKLNIYSYRDASISRFKFFCACGVHEIIMTILKWLCDVFGVKLLRQFVSLRNFQNVLRDLVRIWVRLWLGLG